MSHTNITSTRSRYCITCDQLIAPGLMTCVDCDKILDIIATSPIPSFLAAEPLLPQDSQDRCCMCSGPTMLGSQFCPECECSMAIVLEDPEYAFDIELPSQSELNSRAVTQDMQVDTHNEDESDVEIEVVAALTETELMMQRFEEAKQKGDVVELLEDEDDPEPLTNSSSAASTIKTAQVDDDIQFIRTACSAAI